jgi:phosphoribosylformylglycinamidine synthase
LREQFHAFFERADSFSLGVCNGCQMFAQLRDLIPGAAHWPRFLRNRSEQFEARLALVQVQESPSLFFRGMAGSRIPIAVSHGEGRAQFDSPEDAGQALIALQYVEADGRVASRYPANPNGSPLGIAGLTSADGRSTLLMPHPERVHRSVQMSWHPPEWGENSPWQRMFENARAWAA